MRVYGPRTLARLVISRHRSVIALGAAMSRRLLQDLLLAVHDEAHTRALDEVVVALAREVHDEIDVLRAGRGLREQLRHPVRSTREIMIGLCKKIETEMRTSQAGVSRERGT